MMAKKKKEDDRVWLPPRTSRFAREVDVALQLVSRAAAAVGRASPQVATITSQTLVCDGIASEFSGDNVIASESSSLADEDALKAALELVNEIGATTPCVNDFVTPYPDPVQATACNEIADLKATLDKGASTVIGERSWVLAPITDAVQPSVSLTLLEGGQPVVCAVALPNLPRNSMAGEKLLRMTVSFDGQSGALPPPEGTIMWAEENIGAYERSVGGEHGTDVVIRVDRSLIGKRDIASGQVTGVQDFADVTICEAAAQPRAADLAKKLGITSTPLQSEGPFAYGMLARGEAQVLFDLPDDAASFDSKIWAHAAGALLVREAGGRVTDTSGNELDFSECRDTATLPAHVVGTIATNKDVHQDVLRTLGQSSLEAAAAGA